jgi:hypothetical protein
MMNPNPTPPSFQPPVATPLTFVCSICGEPSTEICGYCTKDACANHRCEVCLRCSDCCDCDKQRRR